MKTNSPVKILMVDDRPENLFALEVILSEENYLCVRASSGEEALKIILSDQDFAIILMDVQMPMMDGFETVELIRQNEKLKLIPIIFLTASMDSSVQIFKGYLAGAVDYMIKPLSPEILRAKVGVFVDLYTKTHELLVQHKEKEKRAGELIIANIELAFQNDEKEKRAAELVIANKELAFQNDEKEKRATELGIANKELAFQNDEKEKRAAELVIANKELAFQNDEKEKRAAELVIANKELAFQNDEKEKRAAELVIANKELAFQNDEKEKRAEELIIANKELLAFTYISSHDLQEPLRKIQTFVTIILENENKNLSDNGKYNFERMQIAAGRMQQLIDDLLAFSRVATTELKFEKTELNQIIEEVKAELKDTIYEKHATIEIGELGTPNLIAFQFRQLMYNLISNALKFSNPEIPSHIKITNRIVKGSKLNNEKLSQGKTYYHITVKDNGIGFEPHFSERIFGVFQKLHGKEVYAGTGIGLAIVKKIVENHNGHITATGELKKGASFDIYIPSN